MINLFKVGMSKDAPAAVAEVLESGYIGQGQKVDRFERELGAYTGQLCVAVNSGTAAIELALKLIGVGPGDEVVSTPMTCLATNAAVARTGAWIVWADVDPETGLISPDKRLISGKTKAIVAVDWGGAKADFEKLRETGHAIVEDAAHVFTDFPPLVSGDYVCLSFQAIKFLTTGDGGALLPPLGDYERARRLRWFGLERDRNEDFRCNQIVEEIGFKAQMNDIAAAIGLANLEMAKGNVIKQRQNAQAIYDELMNRNLQHVRVNRTNYNASPWLFLVSTYRRKDFIAHMRFRGIEASPVHRRNDVHPAFRTCSEKRFPLRGLELFDSNHCAIPCGWWLTEDELQSVIGAVAEWDAIP